MNDNNSKKKSKNKSTVSNIKEHILEQLKLCYDPEIPVNVVDLGLIYDINVKPLTKSRVNSGKTYQANIRMTLTTPGCAMGDFIIEEIKNRAATVPCVGKVEIELVFDPPWDRSKMSMQAKLELGIL
jgi:metal-sulfur cluster biosynthetic enzyme